MDPLPGQVLVPLETLERVRRLLLIYSRERVIEAGIIVEDLLAGYPAPERPATSASHASSSAVSGLTSMPLTCEYAAR
jgi:hypothetical protein